MRQTVLELLRYRHPLGDSARTADLAALQPMIQTLLDTYGGLICGAGFVAEPGVLSDSTYWLEWRTESTSGDFTRLEVRLDEGDFAKYDYFHANWFRRPRSGASSTLTGPYVDLGGVNKYLVTLSIPVRDDELFLGIVGADILVDRVEGMLRQISRSIDMSATIVNASGRIIAASIPRLHPGALVHGVDLSACDGGIAAPGVRAYQCGSLPWTLLVSATELPVLQLLQSSGP